MKILTMSYDLSFTWYFIWKQRRYFDPLDEKMQKTICFQIWKTMNEDFYKIYYYLWEWGPKEFWVQINRWYTIWPGLESQMQFLNLFQGDISEYQRFQSHFNPQTWYKIEDFQVCCDKAIEKREILNIPTTLEEVRDSNLLRNWVIKEFQLRKGGLLSPCDEYISQCVLPRLQFSSIEFNIR